jgi:hypothetical protein
MHEQSTSSSLVAAEAVWFGHARHTLARTAPASRPYVPAEQLLHDALPGSSLYCPASHWAHAPPAGPVAPALHEQSVRASLALGAFA